MSYPDRINACNNACFEQLLPWLVGGVRYGWIDHSFAACLQHYPDVFKVGDTAITLQDELSDYQQRTTAVNTVMQELHRSGVIDTWVGERYPVVQRYGETAVLEVERAAASFLGIKGFGVHVNGLVNRNGETWVWVGTRAKTKPFWPGKLDQLVAGGQPTGISLLDNVIKEAEEEAAIPSEQARQAQAVSQVHYQYQGQRGLENSTLFIYDLWLPDDFTPRNNDGEVDSFQLLPLHEIARLTEDTEAFKANCNLVNIDLLLRNNVITPHHPDHPVLVQALYNEKEGITMREGQPQTVYLKDYQPLAYRVESLELTFELGEEFTRVTSSARYQRQDTAPAEAALELYGEDLELLSISLNGASLSEDDYQLTETGLLIRRFPEQADLEIVTRIYPQKNTSLEGLYQSSGNFCTQCEAQGFRKITYYPDRPDVLTLFTTRIIADKQRYPVLLSNGNLVETGELEGGRHWVRWEDPHHKPSYLFALVAGQLEHVEDSYTTESGREVVLRIYTEAHNIDKVDHAMQSLIRAMEWDEQRFGLEYDLDIYMIVAVDDFNMGAMENKGLNIFNSKLVFASPETATDTDYINIEAVIGHEYFHNWTGNRITCRDWFQLSLKEGLTVFRDQEFTADLHSRPVKRIEDVRMLRSHQFAEDSSPMAHPIRPSSYIEINNFYTLTVYEKGAEVVRLYQTLLGRDGFRKGMDLYFERHDGEAVTTEDFLAAMADASQTDLSQLQHWYDQAGTPEVTVNMDYNAQQETCTLQVSQSCAATAETEHKSPYLIPLNIGLLGEDGADLPLLSAQGKKVNPVLRVTQAEQSFVFSGIKQRPVPSLLRDFSAPVKLDYDYSDAELVFLMKHDRDAFNRWDAGQRLAMQTFLDLLGAQAAGEDLGLSHEFIEAFQSVLNDTTLDNALRAEALVLPSVSDIIERVQPADPEAVYEVREFVYTTLAKALRMDLEQHYAQLQSQAGEVYQADAPSIGRRRLKNTCLSYLGRLEDEAVYQLCGDQYQQANNMTDALAALTVLADTDSEQREDSLQHFHDRWQSDTLVMDKWFALQAASSLPGTLAQVHKLMEHRLFDLRNPNKVRALIGSFAMRNPRHFHAADGSGYSFLADQVIELNDLNPQVASRMVRPLMNWRHYEAGRAGLMRAQLERIQAHKGLSVDVLEIVSKSLA